jgi:hypothetical protein
VQLQRRARAGQAGDEVVAGLGGTGHVKGLAGRR